MSTLNKLIAGALLGAVAVHYLARRAASSRPGVARDERLRDRIQARLPSLVQRPQDVEVVVNMGDVSLRGQVLEGEVERVLDTVLAMRGVRHIHHRLAVQDGGYNGA